MMLIFKKRIQKSGNFVPRHMAKIVFEKPSRKFSFEIKRLIFSDLKEEMWGSYAPLPMAKINFKKLTSKFSNELKRLISWGIERESCGPSSTRPEQVR
jgi:hypothetical protein